MIHYMDPPFTEVQGYLWNNVPQINLYGWKISYSLKNRQVLYSLNTGI